MNITSLALVFSLVVALGLNGFAQEASTVGTPAAAATLTTQQAAQHVGETNTVCGLVAQATYLAQSRSKLTFLNLDAPHPNQPFDVVIEDADRAKFPEPPELAYNGKRICVTGLIDKYNDRPQIKVKDPKQISVAPAE